jgi:hypothetical protein
MTSCGKELASPVGSIVLATKSCVDGVGTSDRDGVEQKMYAGVLAAGEVGTSATAPIPPMLSTLAVGCISNSLDAGNETLGAAGLSIEGVEQ